MQPPAFKTANHVAPMSTAAVVATTVLALLTTTVLPVRAVVVQDGGRTWPNSDFTVSHRVYNVTGPLILGQYDPDLACTPDWSAFNGTQVVVYLYSSMIAAKCNYASSLFNNFAMAYSNSNEALPLPAVFVAVDDRDVDTEYGNYWIMTATMEALPIPMTSVNYSTFTALHFNATVTITNEASAWQLYFLTTPYFAYEITLAVTWAIATALFSIALVVDTRALMASKTLAQAHIMRVVLGVCGFCYSGLILSLNALKANEWLKNNDFTAYNENCMIAVGLFMLTFGTVIVANLWLRMCRKSFRLSHTLVRVCEWIINLCCLGTAVLTSIFVATIANAKNLGSSAGDVIFILELVLILIIALVILVCFIKLWNGVATNMGNSSRRRLWKLAFLSIASVFNMVMNAVCLLIVTVALTSISGFIVVNVLLLVAPIPLMISWISISSAWTILLNRFGIMVSSHRDYSDRDSHSHSSNQPGEMKRINSSFISKNSGDPSNLEAGRDPNLSEVAFLEAKSRSSVSASDPNQQHHDGEDANELTLPKTMVYQVGNLEVEF